MNNGFSAAATLNFTLPPPQAADSPRVDAPAKPGETGADRESPDFSRALDEAGSRKEQERGRPEKPDSPPHREPRPDAAKRPEKNAESRPENNPEPRPENRADSAPPEPARADAPQEAAPAPQPAANHDDAVIAAFQALFLKLFSLVPPPAPVAADGAVDGVADPAFAPAENAGQETPPPGLLMALANRLLALQETGANANAQTPPTAAPVADAGAEADFRLLLAQMERALAAQPATAGTTPEINAENQARTALGQAISALQRAFGETSGEISGEAPQPAPSSDIPDFARMAQALKNLAGGPSQNMRADAPPPAPALIIPPPEQSAQAQEVAAEILPFTPGAKPAEAPPSNTRSERIAAPHGAEKPATAAAPATSASAAPQAEEQHAGNGQAGNEQTGNEQTGDGQKNPASRSASPAATEDGNAPLSADALISRTESAAALPPRAEAPSFARMLSQAAPAPHAHPSPAEQLHAQVKTAMRGGETRMQINLNPAELGKLEVRLDITADKQVRLSITADNPRTLDMLQSDVRALERMLTDIGLKPDSGSLSFNLRGDGQPPGQGQGQGQNGSHKAYRGQPQIDPLEEALAAALPHAWALEETEGLDIRI